MRPELPSALAPWAAQLALFADDVALALGPSLARLAAAVGPLQSAIAGDASLFDGFGGLARRGSYERLLLSEWLLADEMPDEFMRRAASMEHVFLDIERKAAVHARGSFALFDAGPSQIGAPRVAHVAALVVLARRAAAVGASFHWGVLQSDDSPLHAGLSRANVREMLDARTARSFDGAMLDRWRARIAPLAGKGLADLWIVGGVAATQAAIPAQASVLRVDDRIGTGERSLRVVIAPRRAAPREIDLALPAERLVARLLRDPFAAAIAARASAPSAVAASDEGGNVVVAPSGRKAFLRSGCDLLRFPIPNSARAGLGRPKILAGGGGTIAAVTVTERRPLTLVADPGRRTLALRGPIQGEVGHFTTERKVHAPWMPQPTDPLGRLHLGAKRSVFFLDSRSWLFSLDVERRCTHLVARDVHAVTSIDDGIAFVTRDLVAGGGDDSHLSKRWMLATMHGEEDVRITMIGVFTAAHLGRGPRGPVCALQREDGTWERIETTGRTHLYATRADADAVVGVLPGDAEALLVRDAEGGPLRFVTTEADVVLHPSLPSNVPAALDERGTVIALIEASGDLAFFSLERREIVGRYDLGAPR